MTGIGNPILLDIPEQIETERLIIRLCQLGDGAAIHEAIVESFDNLSRWMDWATSIPTVAESEARCHVKIAQFLTREQFTFSIHDRLIGRFLGATGLNNIDWTVPKFETGYWLRTSAQGKGYATETVKALTGLAFTHLQAQRIEIHAQSTNTRSIAVAQRCGYHHEGTLRRYDRNVPDHSLRDVVIYSMIRSDWEQVHNVRH